MGARTGVLTAPGWERVCVLWRAVRELLGAVVSRVFPVICLPSTHLVSSLASFDGELFTDSNFRFTFCSDSGSLEISSFQLREIESVCLGDIMHISSWNEFGN